LPLHLDDSQLRPKPRPPYRTPLQEWRAYERAEAELDRMSVKCREASPAGRNPGQLGSSHYYTAILQDATLSIGGAWLRESHAPLLHSQQVRPVVAPAAKLAIAGGAIRPHALFTFCLGLINRLYINAFREVLLR
jgi:hypothetical protein